ncbi:MAG: UDP-N-acetylglucosamine 2-epimerase (non-hydrolyzing) [Clostridia bacterium]|nr:UDP-N-acetylglucosamine 2-epimerase (non-hydrolyzing) [Clostridia bacterium]
MKKIITIIGVRPQFIKAAMVSRALKGEFEEIIIHTGQHYDKNMSDIFFEQLDIPKPKYNLKVGSSSSVKQISEMLIKLDQILIDEKPDYVIVYGDTNSTLAGALAASKLQIPIIHIESGIRSYNMKMTEEQNRVVTDHISTVLMAPTKSAVDNLRKEGIYNNVFNSGDVMCDSTLYFSKLAIESINNDNIQLKGIYNNQKNNEWYLATIHRAYNTTDDNNIRNILNTFEKLDKPVIFPMHPRIRSIIDRLRKEKLYQNTYFVEPVDYLTMLYLTKNAKKVITDSGGLQKECYILETPCITVRPDTEWVETLENGYNILSSPEENELYKKIINAKIDKSKPKSNFLGDGHACEKIVEIIKKYCF